MRTSSTPAPRDVSPIPSPSPLDPHPTPRSSTLHPRPIPLSTPSDPSSNPLKNPKKTASPHAGKIHNSCRYKILHIDPHPLRTAPRKETHTANLPPNSVF
jgi:hypothetical protein